MALGALTACVIQAACVVLGSIGADGIASHAVASPLPALVGTPSPSWESGVRTVPRPASAVERADRPGVWYLSVPCCGSPSQGGAHLERARFTDALLSGLTWVAVTLESMDPRHPTKLPEEVRPLDLPPSPRSEPAACWRCMGTTVDPVLAPRPHRARRDDRVLSLSIGSLAAWSLPATRKSGRRSR